MSSKNNRDLSISEYLRNCRKKLKRGIALITDKQYIFCSQVNDTDVRLHDQMFEDLEKVIHPNLQTLGFEELNKNNLVMTSYGNELIIYFPYNGLISISQYRLLEIMFKEVDNVSQEDSTRKIGILIFQSDNQIIYKGYNISMALKEMKKLITRRICFEEEKIIGKTLEVDVILQNMAFNIGIENCNSTYDLCYVVEMCVKYSRDSFYQKYLDKLFDYKRFIGLYKSLMYIGVINCKLSDLTYDNVCNQLEELCNAFRVEPKIK